MKKKSRNKNTLADVLLGGNKRHRDPQLVEIYQKLYSDRVNAGLHASGFDAIHSGDIEWVSNKGGEGEESQRGKGRKQASERLKMRRAVSRRLLEEETEEVKAEIQAELVRIKEKKLKGEDELTRTPESVQE
jgi:hypothetical protein